MNCSEIRRMLKYETTKRVTFWDDHAYVTKRSIYKLFKHWRRHSECVEESNTSFEFYDGGDFLDIGAFKGYYSALLAPKAKPGSHLVSVEPDPRALAGLIGNIAGLAKTFPELKFSVVNAACGFGEMVSVTDKHGHPCYASGVQGGSGKLVATADGLCAGFGIRPSFVKLDVEGAEYSVLQGASQTLLETKNWMVEIHPDWLPTGVDCEQVREKFISNAYVRKAIQQRGSQPLEWYEK